MKQRHSSLKPVPRAEPDEIQQILYPYGVGVDTHSKFIQVCVLLAPQGGNAPGDVIRKEKEFTTDWRSLQRAADWAFSLLPKGTERAKMRYCIESTGTYHLPVLRAWTGIPCVVNPLLAGPTRRKTDVLDARLLAHHSITGVWKPSYIPAQQGQELRVLWAQRRESLRLATRISNRINNIVLRFGHTFGAHHPMRSMEGEGILTDLIDGEKPGVKGVCPDGLPADMRPIIAGLLQDMKQATARTRAATVTALNYIRARDWPTGKGNITGTQLLHYLCSVPGVGENTALTWLAEVLDPTRFEHPKQVAAFAGCDPSLKVSAGKVTAHVRRFGNERLHQALLYAASGVLRVTESPLGQWGRSIAGRHKQGGHRKACGAVARRLAIALWHVHRKAEPFSYEGYNFTQSLTVPDIPFKNFLRPTLIGTLKDNGIRQAQQLADAWHAGKLALIPGVGEASLATIRDWLFQHAIRKQHREEAPRAPVAAKNSSGKIYPLRPALTFARERTKTKTQPHPQGLAASQRKVSK